MSNHTTNHSTEAVPLGETVSALRLVLVLVGVVVTLPTFLVAAEIFSGLGLVKGVFVLVVAGLLLSFIGSLTLKVGADIRLSTYCIIANSFGENGAKLVNFLIALTILGWFGVTLDIFAQVTASMADKVFDIDVSRRLVILLGGAGMIVTTIFGFSAIDRLSKFAVPLLLAALLYAAWLAVVDVPSWSGVVATTKLGIGQGISIVMGACMVMVTISPDMARFLSPRSSPVAAAFGCYALGSVAVLILAGIPVMALGNKDLVSNMLALGLGVPALLVVILSTWTTNVANLYSASLAVAAVFRGGNDNLVTVVTGLAGVAAALAGVLANFTDFLIALSLLIPPISGIYLVDHFGRWGRARPRPSFDIGALICWLGAAGVAAILEWSGASVTGVSALDALATATLLRWGSSLVGAGRFLPFGRADAD